ncbi:uncharacterized protein LOC107267125 [Cephus cinctus]|uniref:Uncharacterized protein LOC107267125 n=1 Tax=Cephus cinctus TaxID=211228 RepID=A0AAJ7RGQ9_CEPCN|nr:uncharacterized protein LOC107267125 [Cephus cinctus]XP_024940096.1 uncharacterized protein LOC107267125 [Cephus cinctus]
MRVLLYLAIIGFVLLKNMDEYAKGKIYGKRHIRRLLKAQTDAELKTLNALTPSGDSVTRDHSSDYRKADNNTEQHRHTVSEAHAETERCEPELGHTLQDIDEHIEQAIDETVSNSDCESINSSLRSDCFRKSSDGNSSNCNYEIDNTEAIYVITELSPTEKTERFKHEIRSWALTFDISHGALYHLMPILGRYSEHNFPVDPRTLLETPRSTNIVTLSNGNYCHCYFEDILKRILVDVKRCTSNEIEQLDLLVGIDGLPISDSSSSCLWPILCSENITKKVHVIGIFHGYSKPREANEFLQMFVDDITHFINHGINDESRIVRVHLHGLFCDTPAKSFVLSVKRHAGYYSCTRCTINGEYVENTACFPTKRIQSNLRTDDEFARGMYKNNYQLGNTILKDIPNFGCVFSVPNDYMHVICLGVTKKLIYLLLKRVHNRGLSNKIEEAFTHFLPQVRKTLPIDFDRKPRALKDFQHWKSKEFEMFLLYLAPRALYKTVSHDVYDNFMTLHVAVTLLTRADLASNRDCVDYAEKLLVHFTQNFEKIYVCHLFLIMTNITIHCRNIS